MSETHGAILAAGHGTRLQPLTHVLPKPLLPICGRPMLSYSIDLLSEAGIEDVSVNTHHLASAYDNFVIPDSLNLSYAHEPELLGTGGGLRRIWSQRPECRIVAVNGDALMRCSVEDVLQAHKNSNASATMVLRRVPANSNFARVGFDQSGQIRIISEVEQAGVDRSSLTFAAYTGLQVIEPEVLELVDAGFCDVIRTGYRRALALGMRIQAYLIDGLWLDVGTPHRYWSANMALASLSESDQRRWRIDARGRRYGDGCWIHPESKIHSEANLSKVVVNDPVNRLYPNVASELVTMGRVTLPSKTVSPSILYAQRGITHHIEPK